MHSAQVDLSPTRSVPAFGSHGLEKIARGAYPDLDSLLALLEHERIAKLAYSFWHQRGCPEGSPDDDWFRAQKCIREGW
jgi:Protein of unknown function (DUF2934)